MRGPGEARPEGDGEADARASRALPPGAAHYRAYVGPPAQYDLMGATQFRLLTTLGLREEHRLLDLGCGSLRAGRLLIPYMLPDRYHGVEPNAWLVEEAVERELGRDLLRIKRPRFAHNADFDATGWGVRFDYLVAQSVFSHTGADLARHGLAMMARVMHEGSIALVTFALATPAAPEEGAEGWVYPGVVPFERATVARLLAEAGLSGRELPWFHPRQAWFFLALSEAMLPGPEELGELGGAVLRAPGFGRGGAGLPVGRGRSKAGGRFGAKEEGSGRMAEDADPLERYLTTGIHEVGGWCVPQLWQMIWPLAQRIGPGPVAEIGVFEGKFLIGLCKTFGVGGGAAPRGVAIDVFDMQQFNLDGAGRGKLEILRRNLDAQGVGADSVEAVRADSLTLRQGDADRLVEAHGRFRFFSVDGCHEVVHTVNDIEFAMAVTDGAGVIAVDDYTNPNWPGVQEGVARMYLLRDHAFVPLAVGCNKLLLCSYSWHAAYLEAMAEYLAARHPTTRTKRVRRFGFETLTVQPDMKLWTPLALGPPLGP